MMWLWHQFQNVALVIGGVFWIWVIWQIGLWARRDPRQFARVLCGDLALGFAILALLWAGHLSDKYQWPF